MDAWGEYGRSGQLLNFSTNALTTFVARCTTENTEESNALTHESQILRCVRNSELKNIHNICAESKKQNAARLADARQRTSKTKYQGKEMEVEGESKKSCLKNLKIDDRGGNSDNKERESITTLQAKAKCAAAGPRGA